MKSPWILGECFWAYRWNAYPAITARVTRTASIFSWVVRKEPTFGGRRLSLGICGSSDIRGVPPKAGAATHPLTTGRRDTTRAMMDTTTLQRKIDLPATADPMNQYSC